MSVDPIPFERRASDRRADFGAVEARRAENGTGHGRRAEDRRAGDGIGWCAEDRRSDDGRSDERRGEERRSGVAADWRAAQPDAWRLEGFKMQIAQEARTRRNSLSMALAVWSGLAIGVAGSVVALIT